MSRKGDESDEEVYLSDPSDDEGSSVDGYEYTSDAQAAGGHVSAPAEVDWTLHDEEAARAATGYTPRQPVKADEPQKSAPPAEKKTMNPNAAPWVPPTSAAPTAEDSKKEAHAGEDISTPVADTLAASSGLSSTAAAPTPTAAPIVNKNGHEEPSKSPIDVNKMIERVIEANPSPSSETTVSKEDAPQKAGEQKAAPTAQDTQAPSRPAPAEAATPAPTPAPASTSQDSLAALGDLAPLPPAEVDAPQPKPAATQPKPAAPSPQPEDAPPTAAGPPPTPKSEEAPHTADKPKAAVDAGTKDVGPAVAPELPKTEAAAPPPPKLSEPEKAEEPVKTEEGDGKESLGTEAADEPPSSAGGVRNADVNDRDGVSADADAKPASNQAEASSSSQQESKRPAAMPSLPERKKKGAAMPSLPPRPNRRQDVAESSASSNPSPAPPQPLASQSGDSDSAPSSAVPAAPNPSPAPPAPAAPAPQREAAQRPSQPILVQRAPPPAAAAQEESPDMQRKRAQLKDLRVNMLRCAKRLGMTEHALIRQVTYRLEHAERVRLGRTSAAEEIPGLVERLERENPQEDLLQVTAMVIGLTGSGKSATINSLLGYDAVSADAFEGTKSITTVSGSAFGLKLKLVDTPGLHAAGGSYRENGRLLDKINRARAKCKPDLIIYCDRMDLLPTDGSHIPLIRQITEAMGSEMWFNTLCLMTHATGEGPSNPREGPLPYGHFSPLRQQIFQRTLQQAVGDQRMNSPTAFVENSATCPKNGQGEAVLPDGTAWRKFVLLYMAVMKTLSKADECMETGQSDARRGGAQSSAMNQLQMMLMQQRTGNKLPPLPFLVTNMIKHAGPKQFPEVEREIKRPDEIKAIKNFSERRREARKRIDYLKAKHIEKRLMGIPNSGYEAEEDPTEQPSMPPALPPTFDVDDTSHLYRAYEPNPANPGWITRMRLEQNVVDHTDGVESLTTERSFVRRAKDQHLGGVPCQVHAIIEKGKTSQMFQGGAEASIYQNWRTVHTGRAQLLTMSGNDVLYISQLDTHLQASKDNRLTLGGLVSLLGEDGLKPAKDRVALGLKLEDEMELPTVRWKNYRHSAKAGLGQAQVSFKGRKEKALGVNGEYSLVAGRKEDHQLIGSYSQMTYRGNSQKQYGLSAALPLSAETTAAPKLQLQSGGQGSFALTLTSHDHPSIGLTAIIPLGKAIWDHFRKRREVEN